MEITRIFLSITIYIFILLSSFSSNAETSILPFHNLESEKKSIFEHLSQDFTEVPEVTLTTDFLHLVEHKRKGEYQPAFLSIDDQETYEIKIRPRGKFRLINCDIPPIKLNFSKKDLAKKGLMGGFDKLKLVMPCGKDSPSEEAILKEYLTYRLYNLLTPNSFKVLLIKLSIEDVHNSQKSYTRYAFIIENKDEIATRLNGTINDNGALMPKTIAIEAAKMNALFQYMIGNEDWETVPLRNIKVVTHSSTKKNIVVPYDFDFAGIVDVDYALPSLKYQHRFVRQRHLDKTFLQEQDIPELMSHFHHQKLAMIGLIHDFEILPRWQRKEMLQYVGAFFKLMEKDEALMAFGKN